MAFRPRSRTRSELSRRRPIARHETPLIKRVARNEIKKLQPQRPPMSSRRLPILRYHQRSQQLRAGDVIIHALDEPEQFDCMMRIFTRLRTIPGLVGFKPRLYKHDRKQLEIQLQYPDCGISRLIDRVHSRGDWHARLRVHEVRQLRDTLLNDISILCASRVAFRSDATFLRLIHQRAPFSLFVPLLDAFDLDMCSEQNANTIDWAELEKDTVQKVERQFQVFEFLAQIDLPLQFEEQCHLELDPEDALRILKANPPAEWYRVILQVSKYTPELAYYTIENVERHLDNLYRNSTPDLRPCSDRLNYCDAIRHLLRLSSTDEGGQQNIKLLSDRAYLWVVYGAMMVHSHTKVELNRSRGLLQLDRSVPGKAYTGCEDFHLVAEACREALEAIRTLHAAGGKLEIGAKWYIRHYAFDGPIPCRDRLVN